MAKPRLRDNSRVQQVTTHPRNTVMEYATNRLPDENRPSNWAKRVGVALLCILALALAASIIFAWVTPAKSPSAAAKRRATAAEIGKLSNAIQIFHQQNGRYPAQEEGLLALTWQPANTPNWRKLIDELPHDAWGRDFVYEVPGKKNIDTFDLRSPGEDGILGTADDVVR